MSGSKRRDSIDLKLHNAGAPNDISKVDRKKALEVKKDLDSLVEEFKLNQNKTVKKNVGLITRARLVSNNLGQVASEFQKENSLSQEKLYAKLDATLTQVINLNNAIKNELKKPLTAELKSATDKLKASVDTLKPTPKPGYK